MPAAPALLKGTLDVLVLKALSWNAMHGFEIAVWLEEHSSGHLEIDDGALYQALHRMTDRQLVKAEWGVTENNRRARYYSVTAHGKTHLRTESAALIKYAETLTTILRARHA